MPVTARKRTGHPLQTQQKVERRRVSTGGTHPLDEEKGSVALAQGRVLIVDQDCHVRRQLLDLLDRQGLQVDAVTTAETALKRIKARVYDAVFLSSKLGSGLDFDNGVGLPCSVMARPLVAEGIRQSEAPWEQVVGQIYLGREAFIRCVQGASQRMADPEIPQSQRQPVWLSPEAVLQRVARGYGVAVADLVGPTRRPSEARQVAL